MRAASGTLDDWFDGAPRAPLQFVAYRARADSRSLGVSSVKCTGIA
jgi:hypothetical protein